MIINFMKNNALDILVADIPNNIEYYNSQDKWIDNYFEDKGFGNYYFNTGIMVPDVELTIGNAKTDYENAVKIYDAFRDKLNPVQASDLRLWVFLAHNVYWDYMRERWAIDISSEDDDDVEEKDKLISRIGARYFYKASKGKAFVRQGIARLYWSSYLTYDPDNTNNPYELTQYFLSKQDIFATSTERSLARNKDLLLAALKVLKEHGDLKRKEIRQFFLKLNQAGGIIILDSLSKEAAYDLARRTLEDVLNEKEKNDEAQINITSIRQDQKKKNISVYPNDIANDVVQKNSRITVKNVKTGIIMPIVVSKNKFQSKPDLIGLKIGDKFKIRKENWKIIEIR